MALLHGYSNTLINIDILINVFHKHDIYQSLSISMQQRPLRERIEEKDKHLDDVRQALRLLEDKTEKKKGWKWW
jgi:hypothetical protein